MAKKRSEIGQGLHEITSALYLIAIILAISFLTGCFLLIDTIHAADLNTCVYKGFYVNEKENTLHTMFTCMTDENKKMYLIGEIKVHEPDSRDQDQRRINQTFVRN